MIKPAPTADASSAVRTKPLSLRFQSDPATLAPVRLEVEALAAGLGFEEDGVFKIGLCVNEALANVIRHAYGNATDRPIELTAEPITSPAGIRIRIRDWGCGVDPLTLPKNQVPKDPLNPGGLGLPCLKAMMDRMEFVPQPQGGMLLIIERHLGHVDPPTMV